MAKKSLKKKNETKKSRKEERTKMQRERKGIREKYQTGNNFKSVHAQQKR